MCTTAICEHSGSLKHSRWPRPAAASAHLHASSKKMAATAAASSEAAAAARLDRAEGALRGLVIGDAFAMPAHWYYNVKNLREEVGELTGMRAPHPYHAESMVGGMSYDGKLDILHTKAADYKGVTRAKAAAAGAEVLKDEHGNAIGVEGERPRHYHATLAKGQNTANICIARLFMRHMATVEGVYDPQTFLEAVEQYMLTPPPPAAASADPAQLVNHNDTYLDMFLRRFFEKRSGGVPLLHCAARQRDSWSIGSLDGAVMAVPAIVAQRDAPEAMAVAHGVEHAALTHNSVAVFAAVAVVAPLLQQLIGGADPDAALRAAAAKVRMPKLGGYALVQSYREAQGPGNIPKPAKWEQHNTFAACTLLDALVRGEEGGGGPLLEKDPADVAGMEERHRLSTACYVEHALPVVLYLALKFGTDFQGAQRANAAVGGHSTARAALLGAIMGARVGVAAAAAADWFGQLAAPDTVARTVRAFLGAAGASATAADTATAAAETAGGQ